MKNVYFLFLSIIILSACTPKANQRVAMKQTIKPHFDWQGHRGARGLMPENTIPAFIKALEYKVKTLELDICISKDKQVIVSHEPWFSEKICSKPDGSPVTKAEAEDLKIYEMTYDEIKYFDCGIRGNERFPDQVKMKAAKPSLKDMVKTVYSHCRQNHLPLPRFDIEIKSHEKYYDKFTPAPEEYVRIIVEEVKELGIEKEITLQSFDLNILEEVHKQAPDIIVAYLVDNLNGFDKNMEKISFVPDIYSPYFKLIKKGTAAKVHARDMRLIPWTVNEVEDMEKMIRFGVDGIITDYPNRIRKEWLP